MLSELFVITLLVSANLPAIDGVYPDPVTPQDRGEFVVVTVPENASNLSLSDGESTVDLSNLSATGRVAITDEPGPARMLTNCSIHVVDSFLSLANGGETVHLRRGNRTVDTVRYPRATEAEMYQDGRFTPLGRTSFEPMATQSVSVTRFLLPDKPAFGRERIESATERILLAGYTFSDPTIADALIRAHNRNVSVKVLLEGGPVGGISQAQVRQVDRLRAAGIQVSVMGTARARYRYHHAKYAVVDDQAVVTSENWKPAGIGGNGSRGWGVVIDDPAVANNLSRIFRADSSYLDTVSWAEGRPNESIEASPANTTYPDRFETQSSRVESVTILAAPDNAGGAVKRALDGANESIHIQQVSVDPEGPLVNATVAAAKRGVSVRLLLSGEWYVESENRAIVNNLRQLANTRNLPLEVRLAEPRSRYEHVHVKGLIVDGESTFVGSLNWNENARTDNREVLVRIDDPATATQFERVFRADWRGAAWRISWIVLLAVFVALGCAIVFAGHIANFEAVTEGVGPE